MAKKPPRGFRRAVPALEQLEDRVTPSLLGNQLFPADYPRPGRRLFLVASPQAAAYHACGPYYGGAP
jgi:hypothetical protein